MSEYNEANYQIAIVGLSGRFPKSKDIKQFWNNLIEEKECITFFTDSELMEVGINSRHLKDNSYVKARPYIDDIDLFDADFFKINSREALLMDPQHRLFLECSWEALEDAGCVPENSSNRIGLFAACDTNTYLLNNIILNDPNIVYNDPLQFKMNDKDYLCSRVSYKLNLTGPSIMVQSACSSSLTAIHVATESILSGECDMALAGAVSLTLPQKSGYFYKQGGVASKDGHCRPFDKDATGTVYGDGLGVVVLKRLSDALEDHDNIYAVIKSIAVNNDGASRAGYTAPGLKGQSNVIEEALEIADVGAESISYVEAHGTGTDLGDSIEIAALTEAYGQTTSKKQYCGIGSVKSNIGHTSTASGIASVIKLALAFKNERIPTSINFTEENEKINFKDSPFYMLKSPMEWKRNSIPRIAGLSAFGLGGTNAHMILEESPDLKRQKENYFNIVNLSARTEVDLQRYEENIIEFLENNKDADLRDIAFTLQSGRKEFDYRSAVIGSTEEDILLGLKEKKMGRYVKNIKTDGIETVFMFPGVGEEYSGVAKELYYSQDIFKKHFDICSNIINEEYNIDLVTELFFLNKNDEIKKDTNEKNLFRSSNKAIFTKTEYEYLAVFSLEYSLAQFLIELGITPSAMIGYSIGEYVAACLAGVFSLEDTIYLLYNRGRLINKIDKGAMLSIMLPKEKVVNVLNDKISICAVNSPNICVVGGDVEEINKLEKTLINNSIACKGIPTTHAFHSKMMKIIKEEYTEIVNSVNKETPKVKVISNVTGNYLADEMAIDSNYWSDHLCEAVQFSEGIKILLEDKYEEAFFIEVGVGNTLATFLIQNSGKLLNKTCSLIKNYYESESDNYYLYKAVSRLWSAGFTINWSLLFSCKAAYKISLPTYPFARKRYWLEPNVKSLGNLFGNFDMNNSIIKKEVDTENDKKLISLEREYIKTDFELAVTDTEKELLKVWEKNLGYENIGINDGFFEIGGNSLLAVNILSEIRNKYNIELSLEDFYKNSSIAYISKNIDTYRWLKNGEDQSKNDNIEDNDNRQEIYL